MAAATRLFRTNLYWRWLLCATQVPIQCVSVNSSSHVSLSWNQSYRLWSWKCCLCSFYFRIYYETGVIQRKTRIIQAGEAGQFMFDQRYVSHPLYHSCNAYTDILEQLFLVKLLPDSSMYINPGHWSGPHALKIVGTGTAHLSGLMSSFSDHVLLLSVKIALGQHMHRSSRDVPTTGKPYILKEVVYYFSDKN